MHDLVHKLLVQIRATWRWRWYALILAWLVSCGVWIGIEFIPDRYASSARVHIDTDSMLRPLMRGIAAEVNTDLRTRLSLVRRTLLSRPNLEQVMRMTDLDITARSVVDTERILASLRSRLQINLEGRGANLFSISLVDEDPELARDVVQALLTLFVETNFGANREDLARTQRFLDDQIHETAGQLNEAETALARFRIANHNYLPGQSNIQGELNGAIAEMEALEIRRSEEIRVRDEVKRELASVAESIRGGTPIGPQAARIADMEDQLQELRIKLTDSHPDVIALKRLLERERKALQAGLEVDEGSRDEVLPPRLELLRSQVAEHDARIAAIQRRSARQQSKMEELRDSVTKIPAVETEYGRLERAYEIIRSNHSGLLERRAAAQFAEEIDTKTELVQFRVVEPPNLPASPDSPNRPLLRFGGLVIGLGAGAGFAVLLSLALPAFGSVQELRDTFRLPVIGSVAVVPRPLELWRRRTESICYVVVLSGLFGVFLLVISGLPERITSL